ncbi:MAG: hypothetical protein RLZZ324_1032, partial [Candidatus Parcubacteria bacterium]
MTYTRDDETPRREVKPGLFNSMIRFKPDVTVLGVPYDRTSSFGKGASDGPTAIHHCLAEQIETYDPLHDVDMTDMVTAAYEDVPGLDRMSPAEMVAAVTYAYDRILDAGSFPLIIGGDHSVSNGAFLSLAKGVDAAQVTILHIDAHLDLRDDDGDFRPFPYGKFSHASVMRRAADLGFRFCHVGVRAFCKEEIGFARENGHTVHAWVNGWPREEDMQRLVVDIPTKLVYLSIDVDGLDPSVVPGT